MCAHSQAMVWPHICYQSQSSSRCCCWQILLACFIMSNTPLQTDSGCFTTVMNISSLFLGGKHFVLCFYQSENNFNKHVPCLLEHNLYSEQSMLYKRWQAKWFLSDITYLLWNCVTYWRNAHLEQKVIPFIFRHTYMTGVEINRSPASNIPLLWTPDIPSENLTKFEFWREKLSHINDVNFPQKGQTFNNHFSELTGI